MRVRLFHWKSDEAQPLIKDLRRAGFMVDYRDRASGDFFRSLDEHPYLAAVIDLTRMPSHGRYLAVVLRSRRSTRQLPIVFLDGDPEKVELIRQHLPDAVYTSRTRLVSTLNRVKPVANPVRPSRVMDSYSSRTTAQKLGIKADSRTAVIDPP